MKIADISI